ncbi:MAG: hypothetical protein DMF98_03045 [Acidobacteria bacterium]|nr:MAG: hypothetical protein DMF98_03045 [Acidobacteriota bacterium]
MSTPPRRRPRGTLAPEQADTQAARGAVGQHRPIELDPEPATPGGIRAFTSELPAWQPNEDDIRLRAYHRYLERGGGHGMAFDDWLEAERELKLRG